jgi:hypothetical protein
MMEREGQGLSLRSFGQNCPEGGGVKGEQKKRRKEGEGEQRKRWEGEKKGKEGREGYSYQQL